MDVVYTNFRDNAEPQSLPPLSGRYARILVDGMEKEAPLSIIVFRYAPGQKGPVHSHKTETETYITLKGRELWMWVARHIALFQSRYCAFLQVWYTSRAI